MKHYLLKLKFVTPVHFGNAQDGGQLERAVSTCRADTFFSALVDDTAVRGLMADADKLIRKVKSGEIRFSDFFPYYDRDADGECELYLPKPLVLPSMHTEKSLGLAKMRDEATLRKKQKKQAFVRASLMKKFLKCVETGESYVESLPEFGVTDLVQKVNCRESEPLPYFIGTYSFAPNAGLYFLLSVADEQDAKWVERLIEGLGYSGIGGRRSSGYGKFELREDLIEMSGDGVYEDDAAIYAMIADEEAKRQMLLSVLLPAQEEVASVKEGQYKLIHRSGFISSLGGIQQKRDGLYMIEAGSCFPQRMNGKVVSIAGEDAEHEVLRYGIGMFAGLPL